MTRQYTLPLPHHEAMGSDDFLITACNREAAAWIETWPNWPSHGLIIHGESGGGKTHLLRLWLQKCRGVELTPENLAAQGARMSDNPIIAVDNADQLAGNPQGEEALFHLHNRIAESKGSLLLTMRRPPAQADFKLPDLSSRLLALPAASLLPPDDDFLAGLLIKQFRDRQIRVGEDVIAYILPRIERTHAAVRDIVTQLDQASLAENRAVTMNLARRILMMSKETD
jgi:chromosomal replication initiation ATPase DnaA